MNIIIIPSFWQPLHSEPAEIEKDMKVIRDAENRLSNEEVKVLKFYTVVHVNRSR